MIVLGHRGGRGEGWPAENTLEAFERALSEGADGVELDVRSCASGEPVLLHDPSLRRSTNGVDSRLVHCVSRRELPLLPDGTRIPGLGDALDLCRGRIVNVEVKSDVPRRFALVRAVVRELARARGVDVVLSSFDPAIVLAFAAVAPHVPRAMLVSAQTPRLGTILPLAMRRAISAAHLVDLLASASRVERLSRAGLRTVVWTVNEPARAVALAGLGVGWVITDQPGAIVAALRATAAHPGRGVA
jgi:glycerophosphoryl diester phosphodiesterase